MLPEKSTNTTTLVGGCASAATETAAGAKNADRAMRSSPINVCLRALGAPFPDEDSGHHEADGDDPARQVELGDRHHQHDEGGDHHHCASAREPHSPCLPGGERSVDLPWPLRGKDQARSAIGFEIAAFPSIEGARVVGRPAM